MEEKEKVQSNGTEKESTFVANKPITVMASEPWPNVDPVTIKKNLNGIIKQYGLAEVYAYADNERWWLADEMYDTPLGCTKEVFDEWGAILDELTKQIIEIIKEWNKQGSNYPTADIGTRNIVSPYMEANGYIDSWGWWVEKEDYEANSPDYVVAHQFSSNHKASLLKDKVCGCFYCLELFDPKEITEWLEGTDGDWLGTAICPHCGIDSVIGESSGYPITKEFLEKMHQYWFESGTDDEESV